MKPLSSSSTAVALALAFAFALGPRLADAQTSDAGGTPGARGQGPHGQGPQGQGPHGQGPHGQGAHGHHGPRGTMVALRAQAELALENDEARIVLYAQEQHAERGTAASAVNTKMKDAIARVKAADPSAEVKTTGYNTYPVHAPQTNRITGWTVRQDLSITTRNLSAVEKLVAGVQNLVNVGGVSFVPSREAQQKAQDRLMELAFEDLRRRIAQVARGLGKTPADATIVQIDLSGDRPMPMAKPMMMEMRGRAADAAAPSFEPGDSDTRLEFGARVRFR